MQLLKTNYLLLVVSILLFCCSCVEDVDLDEKRTKKIVVNCILTTDSIQTLALTYSNPLNQFYYDEVESAVASLFLDSAEVGKFEKISYSKWQLKHKPKLGGNYRLKIEVPDWDAIEATTTMPPPVWMEKTEGNNTYERSYFKQRYAPNPYWVFVMSQQKDTVMVNPIVEGGDKLQTSIGSTHPDSDNFNTSDRMVFEGKGTTREHLAYIRITPEGLEDETLFYLEARLGQSLVFFRSVSHEYDYYMKSSVQKMMVYDTFDDPTQWFDENEIYTNITNGLGVFAAYSDRIIQCHYSFNNNDINEP